MRRKARNPNALSSSIFAPYSNSGGTISEEGISDTRTPADVKTYLDDCQAQLATYDTAWKHMTQRESLRRLHAHTNTPRHDDDHHLMIAALWRNVYNADSALSSSALTSLMSYIQCQMDRLSQWSDNEVFERTRSMGRIY